MLMTSAGQSVRIACAGISKIGRATQGVKLMNLKAGEMIQDVARIAPDETEGEEVEVEEVEGAENEEAPATENADSTTAPEVDGGEDDDSTATEES